MNTQLERIKIEAAVVGNDELTVEDALFGKLIAERREHLGEVAIERLFVAALQENFIAIAKNEDTEAVPLGLVDPAAFRRDGVDALREHGEKGRIDDELHMSLAASEATRVWMRSIVRAVVRGRRDRFGRMPGV